ncbi:MAG: hypothetical protein ABEJ93_03840 [Candidatus Nanohalobium sp.]
MQSKGLLLLVLVTAFSAAAAANQVHYIVDADRETANMTVQVRFDCEADCAEQWQLNWDLPQNASVEKIVNDGREIRDYTVIDNRLTASSYPDSEEDPEVFHLHLKIDRKASNVFKGLYKREFNLRSFEEANTTGRIQVENLLSFWTSHGVKTSLNSDNLSFKTEGPLRIRFKTGNGYSTEYYEFFGAEPEEAELAYKVSAGTTGLSLNSPKLPVAVMPEKRFNKTVSPWSSGEYTEGSAKMRQGLGTRFLPVLAHETVHALNERFLSWDRTSSSFFEEGTSSYIEFLVTKKLYRTGERDRPPRTLFGEDKRFDPDPDDNYYRTLPSKGDREVLWNYYRNDKEFMKYWSPFDASSSEVRRFGYAYSELLIQNYVSRMNGSLRELYTAISPEEEVESPEEKWRIYSRYLDMTPCKYSSRDRFQRCLDRINSYNYTGFTAEPGASDGEVQVSPLKMPEPPEKEEKKEKKEQRNSTPESVEKLSADLVDFIQSFLNHFYQLLNQEMN